MAPADPERPKSLAEITPTPGPELVRRILGHLADTSGGAEDHKAS